MSDLSDFFAKKDRKKKKPDKAASGDSKDGGTSNGTDKIASSAKSSKTDDGWIELEEAKTAKVNTGGRTVADFKKENEDSAKGDGDHADKFGGWKMGEEEAQGDEEVTTAVPQEYPTLAATANAPEVPKSRPVGPGGSKSAPQYIRRSNQFAGLKKLLEKQNEAKPTDSVQKQ